MATTSGKTTPATDKSADSTKAPADAGTVGDAEVTHANATSPIEATGLPDVGGPGVEADPKVKAADRAVDKALADQEAILNDTDAGRLGALAQARAAEGGSWRSARPDAGPTPVDARALTLSKQIQAARLSHGDDVVDAALAHADQAADVDGRLTKARDARAAAAARIAADTDRNDVPAGRAPSASTTTR